MSTASNLLRADLRDFAGYKSARTDRSDGDVWLNANESGRANRGDVDGRCRRYPAPQPQALCERLADLYGIPAESLLVGRGSDEAIDVLVRAFCAPGQGTIVTAPPVFGMYAVCARLHGARVIEVPLVDEANGFRSDLDAMANAALESGASLVFVCSPGNPSGELVDEAAIVRLLQRLEGRAIVVVDEAYVEYAASSSLAPLIAAHDNLVVLRTLSKAHALAAARIGVAIAQPELIAMIRRCQAPYPMPEPATVLALQALEPESLAATCAQVDEALRERASVQATLAKIPGVRRVYPSAGNFLLVRFTDAEGAYRALLSSGVVVRDMRAMPQLDDALRITIGRPEDNQRMLAALRPAKELAA
ncbi:histidinol-phosphate transaminase [Solilutibacter silvestris]|uniref:Histidinol-phosphate aminotransferase n=1 Tax=Solilutibacter silvestris TaxID=1645665 RepID=A0A2K1PZZ3_9GAMM|nr:histidinol-phosphate transaminase [Lysobacter silvestris]PNS08358.1 hisC: histidinol-phosphate transaminase [Lysobacter silvestris]